MPWLEEPKKSRGRYRAEGTNRYKNWKWEQTSKKYRALNLWCEVWLHFGHFVKCDCTDHIIAVEDGGAFWNEKNFMAMSNFWHSRKSNLEGSGLKLESVKVRGGGKIPKDREEIFRILEKRFKRDINIFE